MHRRSLTLLLLGLILLGRSCFVHGLELMESEKTDHLARLLLEQTGKLDNHPWEGSSTDARGMMSDKQRIIVIPRTTLVEDLRDPQVATEQGALLGGLYLSPEFQPLLNGDKINPDRLPHLSVEEASDAKLELLYLRLSVRHVGDSDWRLLVFGSEDAPLIDTPFKASAEAGEGKLAVRIDSEDPEHRRLILQVFGKYESAFEIAN